MASKNIGRVVGKSAYEIALEKGYIGTESEWLESLKGAINGIPIETVIGEMKEKIAVLESRLNAGGGNEVPPTNTETILATWVGGVS